MNTSRPAVIDLMVASGRASFATDVRRLVTEADGVRVGIVEGGPGPSEASERAAVPGSNGTMVFLIDAATDAAGAVQLVQRISDRQSSSRVVVAGPGSDPSLILAAQRAGASEYLPVPLDRETLLAALQRIWKRTAPETVRPTGKRGRILTFLGSKGGCGTTTVAANLAVTLARQGCPTVLVDMDPAAADVAVLLDLTPTFGVADVVKNAHRLDRELLGGMILKHASGLEVLCASEDPDRAGEIDPSKVAPILAFLREQFACVVVNTRDAFDPLAVAVAQDADAVHVVTCLDLLALRRAQWSLQRMARAGIADDVLQVVINRNEKNPYISLSEAEKVLGRKVVWTIPADLQSVRHALNEGVPAVSANRNGLHASFREYAGRLVNGPKRPAAPRAKFLGLFSRPAPAGARS